MTSPSFCPSSNPGKPAGAHLQRSLTPEPMRLSPAVPAHSQNNDKIIARNKEACALPDSNDRREAQRFPVSANTECQFAVPLVTDVGPVRVLNISMTGIGLQLSEELEVGSILAIGLRNVPKGFNRVHLVHVVHVTAQSGGSFIIGGNLDPPLTYQELTGLVM